MPSPPLNFKQLKPEEFSEDRKKALEEIKQNQKEDE